MYNFIIITWCLEWFSSWCRVFGLFISEFKVGRHSVDLLRCLGWSAAGPRLVGGSCGFRFRENIARHTTGWFQDPKNQTKKLWVMHLKKERKLKVLCTQSFYVKSLRCSIITFSKCLLYLDIFGRVFMSKCSRHYNFDEF